MGSDAEVKPASLLHSNWPWHVTKSGSKWLLCNDTDTIAKFYNEHDARYVAVALAERRAKEVAERLQR